MESETIEGAVQATAQNSSQRYGVKVGGRWFDGQGRCPVAKGDQVRLAFAADGMSNKIVELRSNRQSEQPVCLQHLAEHVQAEPNRSGRTDQRIARAVALKAAASATMSGDPGTILRLAEKLEEWLYAAPSPARGPFISAQLADPS